MADVRTGDRVRHSAIYRWTKGSEEPDSAAGTVVDVKAGRVLVQWDNAIESVLDTYDLEQDR